MAEEHGNPWPDLTVDEKERYLHVAGALVDRELEGSE